MATFATLRKRNRPPSPSDYSMEDYSDAATDGASECNYGLDSSKSNHPQPPFGPSLTASALQSRATVSPFVDKAFRPRPSAAAADEEYPGGSGALTLSQSSAASSLTFASNDATDSGSARMDLESVPDANFGRAGRSGTIFDSVCFFADQDNHSSVSMESPARMGSAMSLELEPARKRAKFDNDDFGISTTVTAVSSKRGGMDAEPLGRGGSNAKRRRCHVCGNAAARNKNDNSSSPTPLDSISAPSSNPNAAKKTPKSHSLLNYFAKSDVFAKKPQSLPKPSAATPNTPPKDAATCLYCDKSMCPSCTRPCEKCSHQYCTFCSRVDYGGVVERNLCFDCFEEERGGGGGRGEGGDVDMMDM